MLTKELQIIAFNNPYPANYGGVIDIYYKIKALSKLGVKIHLHFFTDDRHDVSGIESYCETIYSYKRQNALRFHLSKLPFCVRSRQSKRLLENVKQLNCPILFESIRTTGILNRSQFKQKVAVRCHNIEHEYSWGLYKSETNFLKKIAFAAEAFKLKRYESVLQKADCLFLLSHHDYHYYEAKFKPKAYFVPVFQELEVVSGKKGFGEYALYHGDLSVSDNVRAALFLIEVFKGLEMPLIIASSIPVKVLLSKVKTVKNITFQIVDSNAELSALIENAHVNALFSFQKSGTKLKVFNALYRGRHCILNENMVDDPLILELCEVVSTLEAYKAAVKKIFEKEFIPSPRRAEALSKYESTLNAQKIIDVLYKDEHVKY